MDETCENLNKLGIFEDINVSFDSPKTVVHDSDSNLIDISVSIKEKSRLFIKTGTEIGSDEGCLVSKLCNFRMEMFVTEMFLEKENF